MFFAYNASLGSLQIYIFGGVHQGALRNDLLIYNQGFVRTPKSTNTTNMYPPARMLHCAVYANNTLYVIGGIGEGGNLLNDVYTYRLADKVWTRQNSLSNVNIEGICGHTGVAHFDNILMFGGVVSMGMSFNQYAPPAYSNQLTVLDTSKFL